MTQSNKTIITLSLPATEGIDAASMPAALTSAQALLNKTLNGFGISFHASLEEAEKAIGKDYEKEPDTAYLQNDTAPFLYASIDAAEKGTAVEIVKSVVDKWGYIELESIAEALQDTSVVQQTHNFGKHVINMRALTRNAMDGLLSYELIHDLFPDCQVSFDQDISGDGRNSLSKTVLDVDPIKSLYADENVVESAANDLDVDYEAEINASIGSIKNQHRYAISTFDDQHQQLFNELDYDPDESFVSNFIQSAVQEQYQIDHKYEYRVATVIQPYTGQESVYFTPNDSVASAVNLVVDDEYLKGLDILKINLKEWIKSLAEQASIPTLNLSLSAQDIVERHKATAGYPSDGGIRFKSAEASAAIAQEVFGMELDEIPETIFDLAVEHYRLEALALDEKWADDNGIDLTGIMSSKECYERFPKLIDAPNLGGFFQNANHGNSIDYEWSCNPSERDPKEQLISNRDLIEVMNNATYGGALAFSCVMDHDDISALKNISKDEQFVTSGGEVHIHDWNNGSGACAPMQNALVIDGKDVLNDRKWYFRNDLQSNYGISGVFGEFFGQEGTIKVEKKPVPELTAEPSM